MSRLATVRFTADELHAIIPVLEAFELTSGYESMNQKHFNSATDKLTEALVGRKRAVR